jgi:hypothetical protein
MLLAVVKSSDLLYSVAPTVPNIASLLVRLELLFEQLGSAVFPVFLDLLTAIQFLAVREARMRLETSETLEVLHTAVPVGRVGLTPRTSPESLSFRFPQGFPGTQVDVFRLDTNALRRLLDACVPDWKVLGGGRWRPKVCGSGTDIVDDVRWRNGRSLCYMLAIIHAIDL